jgi:DNA-binding CsgD family transcriptional regulator
MAKFQFKTDIIQRYLNGESSYKIADSEGCTHSTVLDELKRKRVKTRGNGGKREFKTNIVKRYLNGESTNNIAKDEKCHQGTIVTRLKESGVKLRPTGGGGARLWSEEEDKKLEEYWLNTHISYKEIAENLNRTIPAIVRRIKDSKLHEKFSKNIKYRGKICERCNKEYNPTSGGPQKYCAACRNELEKPKFPLTPRESLIIKFENYEKGGNILEAFVLQSAYFESLIKLFIELKFNISIKDGEPKTIDFFNKQIKEYSLFNLIDFAFQAGWLTEDKTRLMHQYRQKRNDVLHDFLRQVSDKDFEIELKETYDIGKKILLFPEFSATSKSFELIEQQKLKLISYAEQPNLQLIKQEKKISDKENEILKLRLEDNTYEKIGEKMGITRERVRQILNSAISKIEGTFYTLEEIRPQVIIKQIPDKQGSTKTIAEVFKSNETDIKNILLNICKVYNISLKDLLGNKRLAKLVFPRHLAIYFLREKLKLSFPQIAKIMKRKDHTTALHAYRKIENLIKLEKISIDN